MIAFICQTFAQALIIGDYHLHTEAYAALCVNKDKPQMHCNGRCQMAKELKTEQSNDKNNPQTSFSVSVTYFIADFTKIEIAIPAIFHEKKPFPLVQESATCNQPKEIFRPPKNC